ncbi:MULTISPECIES: DUF4149 domain-containing protein [unclassified Campylobacter]|uniref:DUF4149 domain-containing protein n=1 Tax=unclassified Campylobacter TaxID=2593542 RepID=UPI003D3383F7
MRSIYLFLLAALVGIEIALGVFVAPVIFYPSSLIGEGVLTHFQSGILISQIFVKYNYILLSVSAFVFLHDIVGLKFKECFHIKISAFALSAINLSLALSFVYYFTPFIIEAQALGEAMTKGNAEFDAMHKASEYVMKLMMLAQFLLFFVRSFKGKSEM